MLARNRSIFSGDGTENEQLAQYHPLSTRFACRRCHQVEDYIAFIQTFPGIDGPEVFGLHPNADLTFRNKEGQQLLATLMETQPKQASGGTGRSREDMVSSHGRTCSETLGFFEKHKASRQH